MLRSIKSILIFIFLFSFTSSFGQNFIGAKAGVNLGTLNGDDNILTSSAKANLGLNFGAVFEIGLSDLISIQPELLFIQKGYRTDDSQEFLGITTSFKSELNLNYFELPVLLKLKFGQPEKSNFFFTVGPSLGYAISGRTILEFRSDFENELIDEPIEFGEEDGFKMTLKWGLPLETQDTL